MVSNSKFQCVLRSIFKLFQLTSLQTPKLSNFENVKHSNSTSLQPPKVWNFSNFQSLNLSNFQAPWVQTFKLQALKLSNSSLRAALWTPACSPAVIHLAASRIALPRFQSSKLDSHSNFQTLNSRPLSNSKLSNFQNSNSSFSKLFKSSNSPISSNIQYVQTIKSSSPKNPTRDTSP